MPQLAKRGQSLVWRLLVSTSLAVTAVFALTGWMVQRYASEVSQRGIEEEVRTSLQVYESLWAARVHSLTSVSRIVSSMSDVRAAFMTRDRATIRDTAEQLWSQVSEQDATFLVLDPTGIVIASLGGDPSLTVDPAAVRQARVRFPSQATGYMQLAGHLFYVVFTPVYVEGGHEQALINILLVAFDIDGRLARTLKFSTHGSDFVFLAGARTIASTLPLLTGNDFGRPANVTEGVHRVRLQNDSYLCLRTDLPDLAGHEAGRLFVLRPLKGEERLLRQLQRSVALFWGIAVLVAVAATVFLSRRILRPIKTLDQAAGEIIQRNYDHRVRVESNDELGRLAETFNAMCESIQSARVELVRQEQIATIGRLSGSIVHDLRNPLAAIYGGAEMLVDAQLTPEQSRRLAASIYSASRRIQELLQELLDVSRSKSHKAETWRLGEIIAGACESVSSDAVTSNVQIRASVPENLIVRAERDRLERVFVNLLNNALDAMPEGGKISIEASEQQDSALVRVEDSGVGIPAEIWPTLFEPFASFGKKNGLGLGLALSRQTLLDVGGDLWAESGTMSGACLMVRIPLASSGVPQLGSTTESASQLAG